jgi:hypothetical protein
MRVMMDAVVSSRFARRQRELVLADLRTEERSRA